MIDKKEERKQKKQLKAKTLLSLFNPKFIRDEYLINSLTKLKVDDVEENGFVNYEKYKMKVLEIDYNYFVLSNKHLEFLFEKTNWEVDTDFGTQIEVSINITALNQNYFVFDNTNTTEYFINKLKKEYPHISENSLFIEFEELVFIPRNYLKHVNYFNSKTQKEVNYFEYSYKTSSRQAVNEFLRINPKIKADKEVINRKKVSLQLALEKHALGYSSLEALESQIDCNDFTTDGILRDMDTGQVVNHKLFGNSCGDSYCPICQRNKAKKKAIKIHKYLEQNKKENYFFFMTLTQPNIHYKDFRISKTLFQKTWNDFKKRHLSTNPHFNGYVYTYELTFEDNREDYIHPHSHILLSFRRRNNKGHLQTSKSVFNVEEEVEKFRNKWTSYFLSRLAKYHEAKGKIYGIKDSYSKDLMTIIDNTSYLEYKKNFSVDIKVIKESEFESVAFEISHYMFKPHTIKKESIVSDYESLLEVYRYKLKMYHQVYKMQFNTTSKGLSYLIDDTNYTNYQLLGALRSRWSRKEKTYISEYSNYEDLNIFGTIKDLQENKLIENKIGFAKIEKHITIEQIKEENKNIKERMRKLEEAMNNIEEKEYELKMNQLRYELFINEEKEERNNLK